MLIQNNILVSYKEDHIRNKCETFYIKGGKGLKLHVLACGNKKNKPILLIHGFAQNSLSWIKQINSDLLKDFFIIAYDLRGHGLSEAPIDISNYNNPKLWADDINNIIKFFDLKDSVLVGWSYGGFILCDYIRYYGTNQLSGLVLVGAGLNTKLNKETSEFKSILKNLCSAEKSMQNKGTKDFLKLLTCKKLSLPDFYLFFSFCSIVPLYVKKYLTLRHVDNTSLVKNIKIPTLIIHGTEDNFISCEDVYNYKAMMPHSKLVLLKNVGHSPHWEMPERFNKELQSYFIE